MYTNYQDQRTQGVRISDSWRYRGLKTVILENKFIKLNIIADKGADISNFIYKPTDTEMLFQTPWGLRNPSLTIPSSGDPTSIWLDYYEGGWQTVVPHGGYPSNYYGADYGIHGDVNLIPWDTKIIEDSPDICKVEFIGRSMRSPFEVKKTKSLKADESLVQGAISEALRYESSGKTGLARYASEDLEINGYQIKKGQMVQLISTTTGMDPKVYENPRKFDIKRDHDKSLSFGQGPHYCIGVTLVRSQTEVMLKELFKRFPNLSLGDEIKYNYDHHNARRMEVMMVNTNL